MKVYWCDARRWILEALLALGITGSGALFGWVATSNLLASLAIGAGWYLITRLHALAGEKLIKPDSTDQEMRTLWRQLYQAAGNWREGDYLVIDDRPEFFRIHREGFRGIQRMSTAEVDWPTADCPHTVLPADIFILAGKHTGLCFKTAFRLERTGAGVQVSQLTELPRREHKRWAQFEQTTGIITVSLDELRELVRQVQGARKAE